MKRSNNAGVFRQKEVFNWYLKIEFKYSEEADFRNSQDDSDHDFGMYFTRDRDRGLH